MSNLIRVWRPSSKVFNTAAFVVPNLRGVERMTEQEYVRLLEKRLRELVEADPSEARELLTDLPAHNPDLYRIGMMNLPPEYPSQILQCDQMLMLLNRIDWQSPGQNRLLARSDLPSLREICETIPS